MDRNERYIAQAEWDSELQELIRKLQEVGENIPLGRSGHITKRAFEITRDLIRREGVEDEKKDLERELTEVLNGFPRGRIITIEEVSDKMDYRISKQSLNLRLMGPFGKNVGLARIIFGKNYWLRPIKKDIATDPKSEVPKDEVWEFIARRIETKGYCESPEILGHSTRFLYGSAGGRAYVEDTFLIEPQFKTWAEIGQPVFEEFVERTGMPTSSLHGMTAIAYNPKRLREVQELEEK